MAERTNIEWAHRTFNPVTGCHKVGPGCDNCYAESWAKRSGIVKWGPKEARRVTSAAYWRQPIKWNREAEAAGVRHRVFCASLADVFDNAWPEGVRQRLWDLIRATPHLDWLLLTKRPGNIAGMLPADWGRGYPNVWLGCTITTREEMLRDAPKLKAISAVVRFWSVEPLLGDLGEIPTDLMPDWIIVGGESGPNARPMHPDFARSIRDQCAAAGVPLIFKQWGEWGPGSYLMTTGQAVFRAFKDYQTWVNKAPTWVNGGTCLDALGRECRIGADFMRARDEGTFPVTIIHRVGKKAAGRLLDGVEHNGFPEARR